MIKKTAISIGTILIICLILNSLVRITDGQESYGIIEEWIFGQSITSTISQQFKSENYLRWKKSSSLSQQVASELESDWNILINNPSKNSERLEIASMAREGYKIANEIPPEYLNKSNPKLAEMFQNHFIQAMELWAVGFESNNERSIRKGIVHYNLFLTWIKNQDSSDFNLMN